MLSFCCDSSDSVFWLGVLRLHLRKGKKERDQQKLFRCQTKVSSKNKIYFTR